MVLQELDRHLAVDGFSRSSDKFLGDRYDRWSAEVRQSFTPNFVARTDRFELDVPYISLRFESAERLIARFEEQNPLISAGDVLARSTLGFRVEPGGLRAVVGKHWVITNESQVEKTVAHYLAYSLPIANRFWQTFSNPSESLKALMGENKNFSYSVPIQIRAKSAIALAMTVCPPEVDRVVESMLSQISDESVRKEVEDWIQRASV